MCSANSERNSMTLYKEMLVKKKGIMSLFDRRYNRGQRDRGSSWFDSSTPGTGH